MTYLQDLGFYKVVEHTTDEYQSYLDYWELVEQLKAEKQQMLKDYA